MYVTILSNDHVNEYRAIYQVEASRRINHEYINHRNYLRPPI